MRFAKNSLHFICQFAFCNVGLCLITQNSKRMIIPDNLMKKWQVLRSPGDGEKMADKLEGSASETFNRAFREGRCRDEVFRVMADFYEEKANLIKEYL